MRRSALEFRWQELYAISLRNPAAVYPDKQPMAYPVAAGAPGAPFGDSNFGIAVMSSLLSGALDLATPGDLAAFVLKRAVDLDEDGYDLISEAYDYLVRYPLTNADLAKVEAITFDGGNEIYPYCYYFTRTARARSSTFRARPGSACARTCGSSPASR